MKLFKWILPVVMLTAFAACTTSKKTAKTKEPVKVNGKDIACAGMPLPSETPHIDWVIEKPNALSGYKGIKLPIDYKVYTIDSAQLDTFVAASKSISTLRTLVPLPDPVGCQVYNLSPFETMNAQLKAKYPNTVTLKGADLATGQGEFNITFNNRVIHAQAIWNNITYTINTAQYNGIMYYIVYTTTANPATKGAAPSSKSMRPEYDK